MRYFIFFNLVVGMFVCLHLKRYDLGVGRLFMACLLGWMILVIEYFCFFLFLDLRVCLYRWFETIDVLLMVRLVMCVYGIFVFVIC